MIVGWSTAASKRGGVDAEGVLLGIHQRGEPAQPVDLLIEDLGAQARRHQGSTEVPYGGAARRGSGAQRQAYQVAHSRVVLRLLHEFVIAPSFLPRQDQSAQEHGCRSFPPRQPAQRRTSFTYNSVCSLYGYAFTFGREWTFRPFFQLPSCACALGCCSEGEFPVTGSRKRKRDRAETGSDEKA